MLHRVLCLAIVLCSASQVASADKTKAAQAFRRGHAAYVLEHWDEAIRLFEEGYKEVPSDEFLYNIARAHSMAGRPNDAIRYYEKCIKLSEDAALIREARERIKDIKAKMAAAPSPPSETTPPAPAAPMPARPPAPAVAATPPAQISAPLELTAPAPVAVRPKRKRWPIIVGVVGGVVAAGVVATTLGVVLSRPKETVLPLESAR